MTEKDPDLCTHPRGSIAFGYKIILNHYRKWLQNSYYIMSRQESRHSSAGGEAELSLG